MTVQEALSLHLEASYRSTSYAYGTSDDPIRHYICRLGHYHCTVILYDDQIIIEDWLGTMDSRLQYDDPNFFEKLDATIKKIRKARRTQFK